MTLAICIVGGVWVAVASGFSMALALAARKPMPQFGGAEVDSPVQLSISREPAVPGFSALAPVAAQTH